MPVTPTEKIWMDGQLVDWADATVHVLTHTMHYGSGVFEGIRAYPTERGVAVFRLRDHIDRLLVSAKVFLIDVPYTADELVSATHDLLHPAPGLPGLRRNGAEPPAVPGQRLDLRLAVGDVPG
jgi:branched-chain amino acid aminotransferase